MALPNQINAVVPAGSDLPSTLDNRIRNLALGVEDILGIPDQTNISNAGFLFASSGLSSIAFQNSGHAPTVNGTLARNDDALVYYDGTSSSNVVLTHKTQTLVNKTLSSPVMSGTVSGSATYASPNIQTGTFTGGTFSGTVGGASYPYVNQLRMSTSTVPVTFLDSVSVTTLYLVPKVGNQISLYDTTSTVFVTCSTAAAGISIAVPATTSQMYDMFCYQVGGQPTLTTQAWTSDTARSTLLAFNSGMLTMLNAPLYRYIGSFRTTTTSGQTEDSAKWRYVWNYYHRVLRYMQVQEQTDNWSYTTPVWRQANASQVNQIDFVVGVLEDYVKARVSALAQNSGAAGTQVSVNIGVDSTTAPQATFVQTYYVNTATQQPTQLSADFASTLSIGRHRLTWLEWSIAAGTTTFYGDSGSSATIQTGIFGELWG